jgi:hypothetical protein
MSHRRALASLSLAGLVHLAACSSEVSLGTGGAGGAGGSAGQGGLGGAAGGGAAGAGGTAGEGGTAGGAGGAGGTITQGGAGGTAGAGGMAGAGGAFDPFATLEALTRVDYGTVPLGVQVNFPVPPNALGFTLLAETAPDEVVGIQKVRPPVGGSVILNYTIPGKLSPFADVGSVLAAVPQSDSADAVPVKSGDWRLVLGDDDQSISDALVTYWVRRTADGQFHGGVVDVNVFLVAGAATQGYVSGVLDAMFPYVGLELGDVQVFDLPPAFATVSSMAEYRQMLEASAGVGSAPALNLFVIEDFADQQFGGAIGVAGGIPGSPMQHGLPHSGVAYTPSGNQQYDATVLRHEVGHLAGLFHTTEQAVDQTDPLGDTPACPTSTIQGDPGSCPDVSNTMFPIAYGATAFSPAQERVLHGSALYRGRLTEGGPPAPPLPLPPAPGALPTHIEEGEASLARAWLRDPLDDVERALLGLRCGTHAGWVDHASATWSAVLAAAGSRDESFARLREVVLDESAPELARVRALELLVRLDPLAAELGPAVLELAHAPELGLRLRRAASAAAAALGRAPSEHGAAPAAAR